MTALAALSIASEIYPQQLWRKGDWGHGQFNVPPDDRDEFVPLPTLSR